METRYYVPVPVLDRGFGGCDITNRDDMVVRDAGAAHKFALAAAELAANTRCVEVVVLDLRGKSPVTEYFVLATGTSPRQMRTAVDEISDLGKQSGFSAWRRDGYESAKWIVLDCVNVVVHLFDVESRDFYDLELLWGDSPRIDWRAELGLPPAVEKPAEAEGAFDDEEEDQDESPVEVEVPDESTGSNSVEFVEAESPRKRGQAGRSSFPSVVEEEEDATAEERAVGPLSSLPEVAAEVEEETDDAEPVPVKKKAAKKIAKKAAPKKAAVVKKTPKKAVPMKKTTKKATAKKAPAKKKPAKKAAAKKGRTKA